MLINGVERKMIEQAREVRIAEIRETTSEERTWAAIAHASGILTLLVGVSSIGLGAIPFVFAPLVIYLIYRNKSKYVAFHAAQAFTLQVIGTVGLFVFMMLGVLAVGIIGVIGAILLIILVGIVVLLIDAILIVALSAAYPLVPLMFGVFAAIAAVETGNGRQYRYPYIGNWVEDWIEKQAPALPPPSV
jgi:uncharacterized protein